MSGQPVFPLDHVGWKLLQAFPHVALRPDRSTVHLYGSRGHPPTIAGCKFSGGLLFDVFAGLVTTRFEYNKGPGEDGGYRYSLVRVEQWCQNGRMQNYTEVGLGKNGLTVTYFAGPEDGGYTLSDPAIFSHYYFGDEYYPDGILENCALYPTPDSRFDYAYEGGVLVLQDDLCKGSCEGWKELFHPKISAEGGQFYILDTAFPVALNADQVQGEIIRAAGVPKIWAQE